MLWNNTFLWDHIVQVYGTLKVGFLKPFKMNSMVILYGFYTFFSLFFKCCVKPKKESQYLNPAPYSESGLAGIKDALTSTF